MKWLLFLFPLFVAAQIPGAAGNGVADDTAALQAWLDSGGEERPVGTEIYRISSTLDVDQAFAQSINWNGATITTNAVLQPMIRVDKRASNGGTTAFQNLNIDGNLASPLGFFIYSRVLFTNVDVSNIQQPPSSVVTAAFRIDVFNDADAHGEWVFDGCDINNILANNDGNLTDARGASNGIALFWRAIPSQPTSITFKNATIENCYGEDSQTVALFSSGLDMTNTNGSIVLDNLVLQGWERRNLKIFTGNVTVQNCDIYNDLNVNATGVLPAAGLIAAGRGSGATGGGNIVFESCNFIGRTSGGRDNRVIFLDTDDVFLRNCVWSNGADLSFTNFGGTIGDVYVCSATFGSGSIIEDYGAINYAGVDVVRLDTDNSYADGPSSIQIPASAYQITNLLCPTPDQGNPGATPTPVRKGKNSTSAMLIAH